MSDAEDGRAETTTSGWDAGMADADADTAPSSVLTVVVVDVDVEEYDDDKNAEDDDSDDEDDDDVSDSEVADAADEAVNPVVFAVATASPAPALCAFVLSCVRAFLSHFLLLHICTLETVAVRTPYGRATAAAAALFEEAADADEEVEDDDEEDDESEVNRSTKGVENVCDTYV